MDIATLAREIHSVIESFTTLMLTGDEAAARLRELREEYAAVLRETPAGGNALVTEGLCCRHNTANFTLLTGLFSVIDSQAGLLHKCGEQYLVDRIETIITKNIQSLHPGRITTVPPHGDLINNLHIFAADNSLAVAALSSSPYFDEVLFTRSAMEIAASADFSPEPDDCGAVYDELKLYIRGSAPLNAAVYSFPGIKKVFAHMGIRTLVEISDHLYHLLETSYPGARIIRFSIGEFIVLGKNLPSMQPKFSYEGIFIVADKREISLAGPDSFYQLTSLLLSAPDDNQR